jgi:peptidoglycan/LPS O-acetylase OafA/YrhL
MIVSLRSSDVGGFGTDELQSLMRTLYRLMPLHLVVVLVVVVAVTK